MSEAPTSRTLVRFGVFELDSESRELRRQGVKVRLQEQPLQILEILLEHPGKVITREELQRRLWPSDTFVDFDRGLYSAIKKLREALGDSAESPRFIETLSRRGYRFITSVDSDGHGVALPAPALEQTTPAHGMTRRHWIALGVAAIILLGVLLGWRRFTGTSAVPQIRSVAVLPLQNLSGDPNQEYFSDALTDTLITDLAQIGSLKVISHTSTMQYQDTKKSLPQIARELNVDGIVEGTVQRSGDRLQINVQLIHAPTDKHLWAQSYEREVSDLFALERDVAENIVRQVRGKITDASQASPHAQKPVNEIALEAYLQGNSLLTRGEWGVSDDEKRSASAFFQKAIDADPDFEAAYIGLAQSHDNLLRGSVDDGLIRKKAAQKVLELNPNSGEAFAILADIKLHNFEWAAAEEEFRKAAELDPNSADAHDGLGTILAATGHLEDGLRECQIAQALDPIGMHLAPVLELSGEYERAAAVLLEMARNSPEDGVINYDLYRTYAASGKQKEAVDELEKALDRFGMQDIAAAVQERYAKSGYRAAMQTLAKGWEDLHRKSLVFAPENMAAAYAAAGDTDRAFYWLNQAYEHREMVSHDLGLTILKVDPLLASLHSDPRFKDLVRRVGLPP